MNQTPADHGIDGPLLTRVFAGEATAEEAAALERWIGTDSNRRELVATLREVWDRTGTTGQTWHPEAALHEIKSRVVGSAGDDAPLPLRRPPLPAGARRASVRQIAAGKRSSLGRGSRTHASPAWRIAAVLAAVALGSALWQWGPRGLQLLRNDGPPVAMKEISTQRGGHGRLRLADGTHVVLGPATTIRYANDFGRRTRDVELSGQAYFDVASDADKPFTVHTDAGVARVLGTRFGVHAYASDPAMDVAVAEGRVAVSHVTADSAGLVLEQGDAARIVPGGETRVERDVNVDGRLAWIEGRLVFDGVPLSEVVQRLGRWYDLEITIADSALASQRVTASFAGEPATRVLEFLASASGARAEHDGRRIKFVARESAR